MSGQGVQFLPMRRIPEKWDPAWFSQWCREVLAFADTRNSIAGPGIVIEGQPDVPATISTSEDLQNLLLQSFVLATPSGFLNFERVLAGEPGIVEITDNGPNSTIDVELVDGGVPLSKLRDMSDWGILGNPIDSPGGVQNLVPDGDKSVPHVNGTSIEFGTIDHTYISDFDEAAQDAVGLILVDSTSIDFTYVDGGPSITATIIDEYVQDLVGAMLTDSTSIDFTYNDGAGTLTASTINANPTATIGLSAVNGTAATPMRSDGAPALSQAIAPTWTGNHTFTPASGNTIFHAGNVRLDLDNQEIQLGASQDLRLYHDGTNSIMRTDTGLLALMIGSGVAFRVVNGAILCDTVTARPSTALLTFNDPSGQKGYFGYDSTNNIDFWNNIGTMRFGTNGAERASIVDARTTFTHPVRLKGYTVATLPTGAQGDTAFVTDALAPTFLAVIVGGGAVVTPVFYDGTNWVGY